MRYKFLLNLIIFVVILFSSKNLVSAACPSDINDNDVTVVNGNTCTIPSGYTYILDKVTNESSTTNSANLQITGGSITIANTAVLKTGTVTPAGGSLIIQNGGSIVIGGSTGTGFWVTDADADGYAANFTTYTATAAGRRRLGLMKSRTAVDCLDNNISKWQNMTGYLDADGDTYGVSSASQVCSGASLASGYSANNTDCYDGNANAKPGSSTCSGTNRGDGSFDYNCSSTQTTCGTPGYSTQYYSTLYGCWNSGDRVCNNFCVWSPVSVIIAQNGCGVSGYASSGSVVSSSDIRCPWSYTIASGTPITQGCQ